MMRRANRNEAKAPGGSQVHRPQSLSPDPPSDPNRLLTRPMVALLLAVALGWSAELLVQATLPLLILDRGGDASLVGLVAAAYALPTLVLRPLIGGRIDRTGHGQVHEGGGLLLTLAPLGFLLPSLSTVPVARFAQGLGWAMYGTANNVVLARLAPSRRRGEASGYFQVMWAVGFLVGPPVGLALYVGASHEIPFVVASLFAATGLAMVSVLRRMVPAPPASLTVARATAPDQGTPGVQPVRSRWYDRFVEPAAVPTMVILALFMSGQTLFLVFAPVYAREIGAPDGVLTTYFPIYGVLLALGQLVTGRFSDHFGRRRTLILGSVPATVGLLIAAMADNWGAFTLGAASFALGAAVINPAAVAATIDRVPPGRTGVAMATFSIGYQLAAGIGGAVWGVLIASVGFPAPFLVAIGLQLIFVLLVARFLGGRAG